jgi:hypothetical protein
MGTRAASSASPRPASHDAATPSRRIDDTNGCPCRAIRAAGSRGPRAATSVRGGATYSAKGRSCEAHRTDKRCSLGFLAARCGWAKCGLPCGPQPDTRHCSLHRGEGERSHRDRPMTRAILRRNGLAVTKRAEGCGGGAGGRRRRVAGAASREGLSRGLREGGGRGWGGAGRRGAPERARGATMACPARGSCTVARTRRRPAQRGQVSLAKRSFHLITTSRIFA